MRSTRLPKLSWIGLTLRFSAGNGSMNSYLFAGMRLASLRSGSFSSDQSFTASVWSDPYCGAAGLALCAVVVLGAATMTMAQTNVKFQMACFTVAFLALRLTSLFALAAD